jgi:hypothetical protein
VCVSANQLRVFCVCFSESASRFFVFDKAK